MSINLKKVSNKKVEVVKIKDDVPPSGVIYAQCRQSAVNGDTTVINVSGTVYLTASTTFEFRIRQNSTGPLNCSMARCQIVRLH